MLRWISLLAQVVLSEVAAAAPQLNLRIGFVVGRFCAQTPHKRLSLVFVLVSEFQQDVAGSRTTRHGQARQNKTNQVNQDMTGHDMTCHALPGADSSSTQSPTKNNKNTQMVTVTKAE